MQNAKKALIKPPNVLVYVTAKMNAFDKVVR